MYTYYIVTRVWDVLLAEGSIKVVYRVSLALLRTVKKQLMPLRFDKIMGVLRELPTLTDANEVMEVRYLISLIYI